MTFDERIKELLIQNGMSGAQANSVLIVTKEAMVIPDMEHRWGDQVEGYPKIMVPIVWSSVKVVAWGWLDEHKPEAWFKDMFK